MHQHILYPAGPVIESFEQVPMQLVWQCTKYMLEMGMIIDGLLEVFCKALRSFLFCSIATPEAVLYVQQGKEAAMKQAATAEAEVQTGRQEQQKLKALLENVLVCSTALIQDHTVALSQFSARHATSLLESDTPCTIKYCNVRLLFL